ncbi:uncharacterized protein LOC135496287 isoform X2 [Lineus longissimus]|uniref:uncharacterized protein LOC135496287 isoform X2 n=1 Tax=Lineus longissimus TaxID=88925 RepID=UPI002B4FB4AD
MAVRESRILFLTLVLLSLSYCNGQFTDAQKKDLTDRHNKGRRLQNAADMNEVIWDEALAAPGQKLAETCKGGHVVVTVPGVTNVGQNLYWRQGSSDPVNAYDAWYGEISSYDKKTNKCGDGAVCGHYRMVVLHQITKIGCGVKVCSSFTKKDGSSLTGVTYVVCHYDDAPLASGPVFTEGSPCSKCPTGKFWCNNNLCQPACTAASATCQCYAKYKGVCMNCGTANEADCTCNCVDGYLGTYCTDKCKDLPTGTDMKTSCTADIIDDPEYFCTDSGGKCCLYIRTRTCRATCAPFSKLCKPLTAAMEKAATTDCKVTPPDPPVDKATTTSPAKITTSTAPAPDACKDYKCINGKKLPEGTGCKCSCFASWQGTACDESVEEAKHGILLTMSFKQEQWTAVEDGLKKAIPKAISDYCNKNFGSCCPGMGARQNPSTTYDISSVAFANVGKGYPKYVQTKATILLFVNYDSNNQLCQDGTGASGRRKRAAPAYLPQDVLVNSVQSGQGAINADLKACCQTSVESVTKSTVKPSAGGNAGTERTPTKKVLEDWEIALIVLGSLLALFFLILLVYFLVRSGVCHKSQKETIDTQLAESKRHMNKVSPQGRDPHYPGETEIAPSPQPSYDIYDNKTQYQVYM